ncbi:MAG: ATP-binding cassette domain-containing protein, partial [Mycoplasmatales bacterium]
IIKDFSFEINAGEMVAISGPSGKGKSSLLYTIGMLHNDYKGKFTILGNVNPKIDSKIGNKLLKEDISFVFQNYALIDNKTVRQNLKIAQKISKNNIDIVEALKTVGLSDKIDAKIVELSGGEQQRVALARVLIKDSKIILADEPTGSLDENNRNMVLKIFALLQKRNITILIVTHDNYIKGICDRVIELW